MNERPANLSAQSIGAALLRNKKKIIVWPLLAVAIGAAVFMLYPRTYRSEAQLFLRVGRESVGLDPTATTGQTIALQQADRKDEIKSAIEVIKSRSVVAQAVDKVGPAVVLRREATEGEPKTLAEKLKAPVDKIVAWVKSIDPISDREEAIVHVEKHMRVSAERESTVVVVQYDAKTPQLSQQVCAALVDAYRDENMRIHRSEESRPFFTEQQDRLQKQLDESLESQRIAKDEMGLVDIDQRRRTLELQFRAVEIARLSTDQQLAASQSRLAELESQLANVPERLVASKKSIPNHGVELLREQLYALQVKSLGMQANYNDSYPLVQSVKKQLDEAKQLLAQQAEERTETTDDINPIHRQLALDVKQEQSVLAGLKARASALREQKQTVLADQRGVNQFVLKLDQLSRQTDLARSKFLQYARTMEEARIDKALENERISNVSIVQPATLAEKPVSPSALLVGLATIVFAVAGTGTLVLASEQMRNQGLAAKEVDDAQQRLVRRRRVERRLVTAEANGDSNVGERLPPR